MMFLLLLLAMQTASGYQRDSSPPQATLWPPPKRLAIDHTAGNLLIDPCSLSFASSDGLQDDWQLAVDIYQPIILRGAMCNESTHAPATLLKPASTLSGVSIQTGTGAEEAYTLTVGKSNGQAVITVQSYVGLLRALESVSQLVTSVGGWLQMPAEVLLEDEPSFEHRGVLLDCARNFMPVASIKTTIDALMYSKMNVLHLHLTDSQSFPLELSTGYGPRITFHGAYSREEVYSTADLTELISYASARGVQLIPEIDTPGHARAFGLDPALTGIVTCANVTGAKYSTCCAEPPCGQLNPASSLMYSVLRDALHDMSNTFNSSRFMHLGFDEVNDECWTSDPSVAAYLAKHNMSTHDLLKEFMIKERAMVPKPVIYWDEVVTSGLCPQLQPSDVVQFWHDNSVGMLSKYFSETPATNQAILSFADAYYLDCGTGNEFGQGSWCDPYKPWRKMFFTDLSLIHI
eukprot:TRINITY_DN16809_c0_g1_i5.p1 TRINITY_DN16809_c0_g1~~TRINITY_DN16809_c0_g1_i5.p1  ORF type:complete len:461 (-),score=97.09 TRINITY_DN16809_c0_g1_i5:88-1470(-)